MTDPVSYWTLYFCHWCRSPYHPHRMFSSYWNCFSSPIVSEYLPPILLVFYHLWPPLNQGSPSVWYTFLCQLQVSHIFDGMIYNKLLLQIRSIRNFDLLLLLFTFSMNFDWDIIYFCPIPSQPALFLLFHFFTPIPVFWAFSYSLYRFLLFLHLKLLLSSDILLRLSSFSDLIDDLRSFLPIFL